MKKDFADGKLSRILQIQELLLRGEVAGKHELAEQFGVNDRSIQRDFADLKSYFAEQKDGRELVYDAKRKGYCLTQNPSGMLTNSEIFAICKILLESRSMVKNEMFPILDKLIGNCTPVDKLKQVSDSVRNERFHYVEPHHGKQFVSCLWDISTAVQQSCFLEIEYAKMQGDGTTHRMLEPVGILFSEYYFYLAAFIQGIDKEKHFDNPQDKSPTIYRIDRIVSYTVADAHFAFPYKDRFEEGEMRKRIQFMYGGELQHIKFRYTGPSVEAVLDRLPTARVVEQRENETILEAEVFGKGIEMWVRSQGENIELM